MLADLIIVALGIAFVCVAMLGHILLAAALLLGNHGQDLSNTSTQGAGHAAIEPARALDKAA